MTTDEQLVRDTNAIWIEAVNARDLDRLLTMITDDLVLLSPGQAPSDRDGFKAVFSNAHDQFQVRCTSEVEEVVVVGDVGYTRCRDELTVTPKAGGETARYAGYRLTVWRKQADGRWLLARDAHTLSPVA